MKKLGIGFILLIIPFINIITGFIVKGYQLECARTSMKKKHKLPEWTKFLQLFVNGILAVVIGIIYALPFIIFLFLSVGNIFINLIKTTPELTEDVILSSINSFTIPGLIVTLILFILALYISPIAIMNFVNKNKFKDAFKLKSVFKKAFTSKYLLTVIVILAYSIVIFIMTGAINYFFSLFSGEVIILIINNILSALTSFIIGVTAFTIIGEIYPKL